MIKKARDSDPRTKAVFRQLEQLAHWHGFQIDVKRAYRLGVLRQTQQRFQIEKRTKRKTPVSWSFVKKSLRRCMPPAQFSAWITPLKLVKRTQHRLVISAPNEFTKEWIQDRFLVFIRELIKGYYWVPQDFAIELVILKRGGRNK